MNIANNQGQDLTLHCQAHAPLIKAHLAVLPQAEVKAVLGLSPGELNESVTLGGLATDLGKAGDFQAWVQKKTEYDPSLGEIQNEDLAFHQELSVLYMAFCFNAELDAPYHYTASEALTLYVIYRHHARPCRHRASLAAVFEQIVAPALEANWVDIVAQADALGLPVPTQPFTCNWLTPNRMRQLELAIDFYPAINSLDDLDKVQQNVARSQLGRLMVMAADHTISSWTPEQLENFVQDPVTPTPVQSSRPALADAIETYLASPTHDLTRSYAQAHLAAELATSEHIVVQGPAGVGKTKIALQVEHEMHGRNSTGILWICPRIEVANAVELELRQCLPSAQIGLWAGGSCEVNGDGSETQIDDADIIVTTLDRVIKVLLGHAYPVRALSWLQRSFVVDEFHEMLDLDFGRLWLGPLLRMTTLYRKPLLLSATPNPLLLRWLPGAARYPLYIATFNDKEYQLSFKPVERYEHVQLAPHSLAIFNTARWAQIDTIRQAEPPTGCYHSYYSNTDRKALNQELKILYGPENTLSNPHPLNAGPAARAALNISRRDGFMEIGRPEDDLQFIGRINRFAEHEVSVIELLFPKKCNAWLSKEFHRVPVGHPDKAGELLAGAFHEYLLAVIGEGVTCQLEELYGHYRRFYDLLNGSVRHLENNEQLNLCQWFLAYAISEQQSADKRNAQLNALTTVIRIWRDHPAAFGSTEWEAVFYEHFPKRQFQNCLRKTIQRVTTRPWAWRRAAQLALEDYLNRSCALLSGPDRSFCHFEPIRNPGGKGYNPQINLRGDSLYATAAVIDIELDTSGALVSLTRPGVLGQPGLPDLMSLSEDQLEGHDVWRGIIHRHEDNEEQYLHNYFRVQNSPYNFEDFVRWDAQSSDPDKCKFPLRLSEIDGSVARNLPRFYYCRLLRPGCPCQPVGLIRFCNEAEFLNFLTSNLTGGK